MKPRDHKILTESKRKLERRLKRKNYADWKTLTACGTTAVTPKAWRPSGFPTRRFQVADLDRLQETINQARRKVWAQPGRAFFQKGIIDVDGTIAATTGACKQGMNLSYKGIWGFFPSRS